MLGTEVPVCGTVPTREFCRALDIGKEESDGPARQTRIHTVRSYADHGAGAATPRGSTSAWATVLSPEPSPLLAPPPRSSAAIVAYARALDGGPSVYEERGLILV